MCIVNKGGGIIISGSALGKELRGGIYDAGSEKYRKQAAAFAEDVLGFKPLSGHPSLFLSLWQRRDRPP